jgi:lysozyme
MANISGPDISSFENDPSKPVGIDFVKMRQVTNFVLIRAGDANFNINWSDSRKAGLARGSFWFYDSRQDPKQEATLWFTQLGGDLGELPLFLDLEETFHGEFDGWHKWLIFLEQLKILVGKKEIGIYTSFYYWRDTGPSLVSDPDKLEYFHQYPLWIAHYGIDQPKIPGPWGENEWLFWQFNSNGNGKLYGAQSKSVDLNYFNGDGQSFVQRFGLPGPADPPPPVPPPLNNPAQVVAVLLNMRSGPDKSYGAIGFLRQAEIVDSLASSADGGWIQVLRNDGLSGWCASRYLKPLGDRTTPPPLQPPSPPPNTNGQLRVIASLLNVREGPGKNFQVLGFLRQDDVVSLLGTSSDESWIQIRRDDNLTGWCAGQYLHKLQD